MDVGVEVGVGVGGDAQHSPNKGELVVWMFSRFQLEREAIVLV